MFITGKYVYKKYKKRKEAKEASLAADSSNHDQHLLESQRQLENTSVSELVHPQDSLLPPPQYSESTQSPIPDIKYQYESPTSPYSPQSSNPVVAAPSPEPQQIQQMQSHTPTEIAVRGKWVWVAEGAPPAGPTTAPAHEIEKSRHVVEPPHSFAVELPAFGEPKEMAAEPVSESRRSSSEEGRERGAVELDSVGELRD